MGLETVREEILQRAKEEAGSILAQAKKEAENSIKEAEKKIQETREIKDSETKKIMDTIKRQELASAELENKKMILDTKKQIIESAFNDARKKLENLDDKKKEAMMKKLVEKAKQEIETAYIYCNKKDSKLLKGMNVESIDIMGGLLAENKEKTVRVDYSFESMLEMIKEREMQNISKILFG